MGGRADGAKPITKAGRTRTLIREAAERRFSQLGFSDTRLEDIAEDVGVKRAALFYHFRDKRALYDAVVEDVFGGLLARIETILDGPGTVAGRFEGAVDAHAGDRKRPAVHDRGDGPGPQPDLDRPT